MDYPKFIVSNQKEESIRIKSVIAMIFLIKLHLLFKDAMSMVDFIGEAHITQLRTRVMKIVHIQGRSPNVP